MNIGIVLIGRNEGPRLADSLKSVCETGVPVIYVDSGSQDDSVAVAVQMGVEVVLLSPPFTAAKARNHGFAELLARHPHLDAVQFLDGDCTLKGGWLQKAIQRFQDDANCAVVFGHLLERNREATPYNRLCALEWRSPPGEFLHGGLGGVFAVRADVFKNIGGFRSDMVAGEDSELGVRMRLAGHKIAKLDAVMADHDADIRNFAQWWKRAVRAGYAIGHRHDAHGASPERDCVKERRSTLFWGLGLPVAAVFGIPLSQGWSLLLLLGYPVLFLRVLAARRVLGDPLRDAVLYAVFIVIGKFAEIIGLAKFVFTRNSRGLQKIPTQ